MKKILAIWLALTAMALAATSTHTGASKEITFSHSVGMDSVRVYAGQDSTSWEINRWMTRVYSGDSTQYSLTDTFDTAGSYRMKFAYYEGGEAVKYLADEMWVIATADYKATGFSTFDPATDIVTVSDVTESGDSLAVLADSAVYQGAAGSLTAAAAAKATADTLAARGYVGGNGFYACTLLVLATADSTVVPNPALYIRTTGGSAILAQTNDAGVDGKEIFALNAATYDAYLGAMIGWSITTPQSVTWDSSGTDTIWATALTAAASPTGMVAIQVWQITPSGDTVNPSYVRYRLVSDSVKGRYDNDDVATMYSGSNSILLNKGWHTETDTASYSNFNMVPNASIYVNAVADTSSWYEFEGLFENNKSIIRKQVPTSGPYNPFAP